MYKNARGRIRNRSKPLLSILLINLILFFLNPQILYAAGLGDIIISVAEEYLINPEYYFEKEEMSGSYIDMHLAMGYYRNDTMYVGITILGPTDAKGMKDILNFMEDVSVHSQQESKRMDNYVVRKYNLESGLGVGVIVGNYFIETEIHDLTEMGNVVNYANAVEMAQRVLDKMQSSGHIPSGKIDIEDAMDQGVLVDDEDLFTEMPLDTESIEDMEDRDDIGDREDTEYNDGLGSTEGIEGIVPIDPLDKYQDKDRDIHEEQHSPGGIGPVGNIPGPTNTTEAVVGVVVPGLIATGLGALAGIAGGGGGLDPAGSLVSFAPKRWKIDPDEYDPEGYEPEEYEPEEYEPEEYEPEEYEPEEYEPEEEIYEEEIPKEAEQTKAKATEKSQAKKAELEAYAEQGFDATGYNAQGYDPWGYDRQGYDKEGYHWSGYDAQGYNRQGRHWDSKSDLSETNPFREDLIIDFGGGGGGGRVVNKPPLGQPYPKTAQTFTGDLDSDGDLPLAKEIPSLDEKGWEEVFIPREPQTMEVQVSPLGATISISRDPETGKWINDLTGNEFDLERHQREFPKELEAYRAQKARNEELERTGQTAMQEGLRKIDQDYQEQKEMHDWLIRMRNAAMRHDMATPGEIDDILKKYGFVDKLNRPDVEAFCKEGRLTTRNINVKINPKK